MIYTVLYVDVQNSTGVPTLDARMAQAVATTDSINGVVMGIPITCEDEIPVLKFLNLLYSDPDVLNIIDWGIEGVHYERVKGTNTLITYPEGVTSENDGYGLNQGWSFGNQLISYAWETVGNDNYYDEMKAFNENAIQSQAIGFIFDSSSVKSEIAALDSVLAEYRLGLENGELDPEEYLPKDVYKRQPYSSPYKIYIMNEAEKMTPQAQNAILKTLEEPPEYAVIMLLTSNVNGLLPTILSRCVVLNLSLIHI